MVNNNQLAINPKWRCLWKRRQKWINRNPDLVRTVKSDNLVTVKCQNGTLHRKNIKHVPKTKSDTRKLLDMQHHSSARETNRWSEREPKNSTPKLVPAKIQTSSHELIHYYNLTPVAGEKRYPVPNRIRRKLKKCNFYLGIKYQLDVVNRKFQHQRRYPPNAEVAKYENFKVRSF